MFAKIKCDLEKADDIILNNDERDKVIASTMNPDKPNASLKGLMNSKR